MHPVNASSGIFSLAFSDAKNGLAAGGDYEKPESSDLANIMRTHDGGKTWEAAEPTNPGGVYFSSVAVRGKETIAGGIKGIWMHSTEWKNESSENINTVVAGSEATWAVGPKGLVLRKSIH